MPEGKTAVVPIQIQCSQITCDILLGPQDPCLYPEQRGLKGGVGEGHPLILVAMLRFCPFYVMPLGLFQVAVREPHEGQAYGN